MARKYKRRLAKTGLMENYNSVIQEYIKRRNLVPVSEEDIRLHILH